LTRAAAIAANTTIRMMGNTHLRATDTGVLLSQAGAVAGHTAPSSNQRGRPIASQPNRRAGRPLSGL
jgi:hypothetical protein